jgi:SPP1 family predicted phage head-tail adaptor
VNAGLLRHRFVIKTAIETKDSFGGTVETQITFATVWASIEPLSGRELLQAQQVQAEVTHRVRMRYLHGVTSKMTGLFGTREFQFLAPPINKDERNRELEIMCKELV